MRVPETKSSQLEGGSLRGGTSSSISSTHEGILIRWAHRDALLHEHRLQQGKINDGFLAHQEHIKWRQSFTRHVTFKRYSFHYGLSIEGSFASKMVQESLALGNGILTRLG